MRRHAIALAIVFTAAAILSGTEASASSPMDIINKKRAAAQKH